MSFYRGNFKPKSASAPAQELILNTSKIVHILPEGSDYRITFDLVNDDGIADKVYYTSDSYFGSTLKESENNTARVSISYVKIGNTEVSGTDQIMLSSIACVLNSSTSGRIVIVTQGQVYEIVDTLANFESTLNDAVGSSGGSSVSVVDLTVVADTDLLLAHEGNYLRLESATDIALTIDPQTDVAWSKVFTYVEQKGAGTITVTAGAGVTLITTSVKTPFQNGVITLVRVAENTWNVIGGTV